MKKHKVNKLTRDQLETHLLAVCQEHVPEIKDYVVTLVLPGKVGFINSNTPRIMIDHVGLLIRMLQWCQDTSTMISQKSGEKLFELTAADIGSSRKFIQQYLKTVKTKLKEEKWKREN